jgi:hypothetical protein
MRSKIQIQINIGIKWAFYGLRSESENDKKALKQLHCMTVQAGNPSLSD